jgi:uncharacterized protein YpmB
LSPHPLQKKILGTPVADAVVVIIIIIVVIVVVVLTFYKSNRRTTRGYRAAKSNCIT